MTSELESKFETLKVNISLNTGISLKLKKINLENTLNMQVKNSILNSF